MPWPQPWDRYDIRKNDIKKQVSAFPDLVLFVHHDYDWFVVPGFFGREHRIVHDDDHVPRLHAAGSRAVQADDPGATGTGDDVSLQPGAVVVVHHLHPFMGQDIGRLHELFVNGDAAHVAEICLRHRGAVDFGFQ